MSVMHFANAHVWEIIGPAMAGPTGPCATPMRVKLILFTFYLNGRLHAVYVGKPSEWMSKFWTVRFLKTESEPNFGFLHIPTKKAVSLPHCHDVIASCPLTKLNGGLSRLHSADEDAVSWLTNYG